jgi:hypothetical protein
MVTAITDVCGDYGYTAPDMLPKAPSGRLIAKTVSGPDHRRSIAGGDLPD